MSSNSDDKSDEVLIVLSKAGDQNAFCMLFLRYRVEVYRCLMRVVRNNETAEDLWQETYLRAWDRIQGLIEPSRFKPWLLVIARNLAFDWFRQNRHDVTSSLEEERSKLDLIGHGFRVEIIIEKLYVTYILSMMDQRYRDVLLLSADGYSPTEIAQQLGYSEATVTTYLSRARKQFRRLYRTTGHTDDGSNKEKEEGKAGKSSTPETLDKDFQEGK
jgi:RNA polymerase sigma-70 factor (ECF subfamily)